MGSINVGSIRAGGQPLVQPSAMLETCGVPVLTREPAGLSVSRLLYVPLLMLPALVAYGVLVDPVTGHGGIPCLWKLLFGVECPGCGLSRADAFLVRGNVVEAVAANWMILPVWFVAIRSFAVECVTFISQGESNHG